MLTDVTLASELTELSLMMFRIVKLGTKAEPQSSIQQNVAQHGRENGCEIFHVMYSMYG